MQLLIALQSIADKNADLALKLDRPEEASRIAQGIEAGNRVIESFVLKCNGKMIEEIGVQSIIQIEADHLGELPDIIGQVEDACGAKVSAGVGTTTAEAMTARKVAAYRNGDPAIVLYTDDLVEEAKEIDEADNEENNCIEMTKAEDGAREPGEATKVSRGELPPDAAQASPPPEQGSAQVSSAEPGSAPAGQEQQEPSDDQVLQGIGQVLAQFKQQIPFFEQQVKPTNQPAYEAVMNMVKGMIALAQKLSAGSASEEPPPEAAAQGEVQKSEKIEVMPEEKFPDAKKLSKIYSIAKQEMGEPVSAQAVDVTPELPHEIQVGFEHERAEHGHLDDHAIMMTALQHLKEDPHYYSKMVALKATNILKDELPSSKSRIVLPVGSRGIGAKSLSVKVIEPTTGKTSWHMAQSGAKMSPGDRHPLSVKVSDCSSSDSPDHRLQQEEAERHPGAK